MRVLVAEDDPVIALGLVERLRTLGHEAVGPVSDGERAVALAQEALPDVYLFDIEMPNLDGLDAAARLADEGLRRPVVVIRGSTTRASSNVRSRAVSAPTSQSRSIPAN